MANCKVGCGKLRCATCVQRSSPILALDKSGKPIEVKLPPGVTAKFVDWSMDDEIKCLESRDKAYRNLALIILAIALGATLRFFLSL